MEILTVPGPTKPVGNRVAACIVTRAGRGKYLKKTLAALKKQPIDVFVWSNGPIDATILRDCVWSHVHAFNVGQHVAHNEMLDEVVRRGGYDWHLRIDDDCWIRGTTWLTRMLKMQAWAVKNGRKPVVLSPTICGLNAPPPKIQTYEIDGEVAEHVGMLGGIFRLSPMALMRYFRWDERQAMGFGDATQFANFCQATDTLMLRMQDVKATHGESTAHQNEADREWEYEHDMLQYMPLGL